MKIAFLTCEYPHPKTGSSGGIGTSIKNLAESINNLGFTSRILVYGQKIDSEFYDNDIIVQQIKNIKLKGVSWWLTSKKIEGIINSLVSKNEIDIVEVHDYTGNSAFINVKCPVIMKLHGSDTYFCHLDNRSVKWCNKFQEKRAFKRADAIIAVSNFTGKLTNELFNLNKEYVTIPNGIDITKFHSSVSNYNNVILYFGTVIRKKGLLELSEIFNIVIQTLPDVKLVIIGRDTSDIQTNSPSTWRLMQSKFSDLAIKNVIYKGEMAYNNMQDHIQKSTICVFPSFAEALPVSWLEAMAMSKAVITSDIGWANEIIENGVDGFLVNPKNHELFAEKIIELLNHKRLQIEMGEAARKKIKQNFSNVFIAQKNIEFYKKTIEKFNKNK